MIWVATGVIIWFLSGKNKSAWFLLFSLSDIFLRYLCAQFSVCVLRKFIIITSLSKELCAWLITRYTFHAHCCVIYQRTITQDADVFWEDQNLSFFILDSLSAQINVPNTKFSRKTMKHLNHNASTLIWHKTVISIDGLILDFERNGFFDLTHIHNSPKSSKIWCKIK